MFIKKDYIYLLSQDKIMNDDEEKALKQEVHSYIKSTMNSFWNIFNRNKILFFDYFTSNKTQRIYSYFATFFAEKEPKFKPLVYEIYAFTFNEDMQIFKDYEVETKVFSNSNQEI